MRVDRAIFFSLAYIGIVERNFVSITLIDGQARHVFSTTHTHTHTCGSLSLSCSLTDSSSRYRASGGLFYTLFSTLLSCFGASKGINVSVFVCFFLPPRLSLLSPRLSAANWLEAWALPSDSMWARASARSPERGKGVRALLAPTPISGCICELLLCDVQDNSR